VNYGPFGAGPKTASATPLLPPHPPLPPSPPRSFSSHPPAFGGDFPETSYGVPEVQATVELQIQQKTVGWLIGKGGKTMREIEAESGARVKVDQSTKDLGYSVFTITGNQSSVQHAHNRVQASLSTCCPDGTAILGVISKEEPGFADGFGGSGPSSGAAPGFHGGLDFQGADLHGLTGPSSLGNNMTTQETVQVQQSYVGWLLGKSGTVLREIEMKSGARIVLDQSVKELGFSNVNVHGAPPQVATARALIEEKCRQAEQRGNQSGKGGGLSAGDSMSDIGLAISSLLGESSALL